MRKRYQWVSLQDNKAMRWVKGIVISSGLFSTVLMTGCDMDMGPMMGAQTIPARFESNGHRIYLTGTSASGRAIASTGGSMHMQMHAGSCATCHGVDRRGGKRMMPRFWVVTPPITPEALFDNHGEEIDSHGDHQTYSEISLRVAITEGIDPAGKRFDQAMPRWSMSERDLADLIQYLSDSDGGSHTDTPLDPHRQHDEANGFDPPPGSQLQQ